MKLQNKHIVIAVCGGIAAYKSAEFVRAIQRQGAQVRVAMTQSATQFITPLTFQALTGHPVHIQDNASFDPAGMDHIALARWSDAIIIAPATANMIAKIAQGVADSFVSSLCLAHTGRLAVAPAMNKAMWDNPATQSNIKLLKSRNVSIFGPATGLQACGETGMGRMLEPQELVEQTCNLFTNNALKNQSVLITAGPTKESIDPVRFISNRSSGKMGYALAQAAFDAGANVTVINGPTHLTRHEHISYVDVESAQQMFEQTKKYAKQSTVFIAAAAVADYMPVEYSLQKIKKTQLEISIPLKRTPDIIKQIKILFPNLFCVGFAAETENVTEHAKKKLQNKCMDMIIANQVGVPDQGFDSEYNAVEIISTTSTITLARARKSELANKIIEHISTQLNTNTKQYNVRYL